MFDLLDKQLLSTISPSGRKARHSLPGVFAGLVRGEIASFSSLRSHQRLVWHAFLVQVATLALERGGARTLPDGERDWRDLLTRLTPDWPDGEPWSLVGGDATTPALMQAPVPGGNLAAFRRIDTPDGLDMLVTSKNHDLKRERMWNCEPEDWLYALISLQTQEGIMGGGKYGISRMNGGFGSRCMIGIDYAGDPCFRFRRDVAKLRSLPNGRGAPQGFRRDRISLVWLEPWDGAAQIAFADLHPLYVEICRRVRLRNENDRIHALETVSSKARIACPDDLKGNTGDPWTPVSVEGKAFSVSRVGFSYRRVCELLDSEKFRLPVLAQACSEDRKDGMAFVAQAVCRGQGKTEGYHERRLALGQFLGSDDFTAVARRRVEAMQELKMAFRLALFVLAQGGPDKVAADRDTTKRFVEPCLERFESGVDQTFFEDVKKELSAPEADRDSIFQSWLESQLMHAQTLLIASHQSMPHPAGRRYQARAQAGLAFRARLSKAPPFEFVFKAQENRETENELRRQ